MQNFGQAQRSLGFWSLPSWLMYDGEEAEDAPRLVGGICTDPLTGKKRDCAQVAQTEGHLGPGTFDKYENVDDFDLLSLLPGGEEEPPPPPPKPSKFLQALPAILGLSLMGLGAVYFKFYHSPQGR
jgi:hypothetical protein